MASRSGGSDEGDAVHTIRVVGAVAAVLVATLVAPAGASSAQTVVVTDGTADTWQTFYDFQTPDVPATYEAAGSTPNTDVTKTTVAYGRTQIKVTVHYADLVKDDAHMPGFREWFRLSGGGGAMLNPYVYDSWTAPEIFFRNRPLQIPWSSRQRACSGITARFDLAHDTLTTTLPAKCLGNPDWIQFHGKADSGEHDDKGVWTTTFQDNVHTATAEDRLIGVTEYCFSQCDGWTRKIHPSKKG